MYLIVFMKMKGITLEQYVSWKALMDNTQWKEILSIWILVDIVNFKKNVIVSYW